MNMVSINHVIVLCCFSLFYLSCTEQPVSVPPNIILSNPVQLWIEDQDQQPVPKVQIQLTHVNQSPVVLTGNAQGQVMLKGLQKDLDYQLVITKEGYLTQVQMLRLPSTETSTYLRFVLQKRLSQITGRITDLQGRAVAGAVVAVNSQTSSTTLSNEQGNYQLDLATDITKSDLTVHKQGYASCEITKGQTNCQLKPLALKKRVFVLLKGQVLKLSLTDLTLQLASIQKMSQDLGFEYALWQNTGFDLKDLDPDRDLLWVLAPATASSNEDYEIIESFVAKGGKLIVSGEWSGFLGWDLQTSNDLLKRFDWVIRNDSVYQQQAYLKLEHFEPHLLTKGLQSMRLYRSASIRALMAHHQILASSSAANFQILATGGQTIWGCSTFGLGHVIVLGDSSLWLDSDSDGNGINNINEDSNAQVWKNILSL